MAFIDTVHLIATEDHLRNGDNSIYHTFIKAGRLHHSNGSLIGPLSTTKETAIEPSDLTLVYQGGPDHVAWTIGIRLDQQSHPYIAFSVQIGEARFKKDSRQGGEDLRFFYCRWDGVR